MSYLNPFSCKIQIFKVRVKVSYFLRNIANLQRFFIEEPWPWTWCPQGVFGGKLLFKKMSSGGRLCTLQENPHFCVPTIKVRHPDGTSRYRMTLVWNQSKRTNFGPLLDYGRADENLCSKLERDPQTTVMNLGLAHCPASRALTLDLLVKTTKRRNFVIQGFILITKF